MGPLFCRFSRYVLSTTRVGQRVDSEQSQNPVRLIRTAPKPHRVPNTFAWHTPHHQTLSRLEDKPAHPDPKRVVPEVERIDLVGPLPESW